MCGISFLIFQINVNLDVAEIIIDNYNNHYLDRGLFHDATHVIFPVLCVLWKRYVWSILHGCKHIMEYGRIRNMEFDESWGAKRAVAPLKNRRSGGSLKNRRRGMARVGQH